MSCPIDTSRARRLQRHDLVLVDRHAWAIMLQGRPDLDGVPELREWALRRWPVMIRRRDVCDGETSGDDAMAVAVALPPTTRPHRFALRLPFAALVAERAPVSVHEVAGAAPPPWRPTLRALAAAGEELAIAHGVVGSLLWQFLTDRRYLRDRSDLDLVWRIESEIQGRRLASRLRHIDSASPMRIDGEFILPDGGGVSWREFVSGAADVVVKTVHGVEICSVARLFAAASQPAAVTESR